MPKKKLTFGERLLADMIAEALVVEYTSDFNRNAIIQRIHQFSFRVGDVANMKSSKRAYFHKEIVERLNYRLGLRKEGE